MSGRDSQQEGDGANCGMSATVDIAHVLDPRTSIQRGLAPGFGRGSKLLGIPTANMDMNEIGDMIQNTATGIYFGFTMLRGTVYPAVVSIGWNPYFDNNEKTLEPHLLHTFEDDFYGEKLHLLLCGFIRNELNFTSLDDLIVAIEGDIAYARGKFAEPDISRLATEDPFWAEVAESERTTGAAVGTEDPDASADEAITPPSTASNSNDMKTGKAEPEAQKAGACMPDSASNSVTTKVDNITADTAKADAAKADATEADNITADIAKATAANCDVPITSAAKADAAKAGAAQAEVSIVDAARGDAAATVDTSASA